MADQRAGAITRYFPDGTLDASFSFSRTYKSVTAAAATAKGKIVLAAVRYVYDFPTEEILRLNEDGSIDSNFQTAVVASESGEVRAITIEPDGKILVAGFFTTFADSSRQFIVRLLEDGGVDESFHPPIREKKAVTRRSGLRHGRWPKFSSGARDSAWPARLGKKLKHRRRSTSRRGIEKRGHASRRSEDDEEQSTFQ